MQILRRCAFVALLWVLDVPAAEAQCSYSVSPTSFTVTSLSGNRTITIITGTQCSWTAVTTASWITVASGAAGTGIGSTTIIVAENPTAGSRTGTLTVAGQVVTITQEAGSCSYNVTPVGFSVDATATSRTLSIITGTQCSWTATVSTSAAGWITVTSGAAGSGMGAVTFSIAANATGPRTGTLTVAGQPVSVNQAGSGGGPSAPQNLRIVR